MIPAKASLRSSAGLLSAAGISLKIPAWIIKVLFVLMVTPPLPPNKMEVLKCSEQTASSGPREGGVESEQGRRIRPIILFRLQGSHLFVWPDVFVPSGGGGER